MRSSASSETSKMRSSSSVSDTRMTSLSVNILEYSSQLQLIAHSFYSAPLEKYYRMISNLMFFGKRRVDQPHKKARGHRGSSALESRPATKPDMGRSWAKTRYPASDLKATEDFNRPFHAPVGSGGHGQFGRLIKSRHSSTRRAPNGLEAAEERSPPSKLYGTVLKSFMLLCCHHNNFAMN